MDLLKEKHYRELREMLLEMQPMDIATLFEEMPRENMLAIFRLLPKDQAAQVFSYMGSDSQQLLIELVSDREITSLMSEMFLDDATDFIEDMPANVVKRVLANTDDATRREINAFLQYPEESAGSIMTNEFVDLRMHITVTQAFEHIRKTGLDKETVYSCYVIDDNRRLQGVVSVRRLLLSEKDALVGDIMDQALLFAHVNDDQEGVAAMFERYDLLALPVLDHDDCLVGIITIDDVIDVIQAENTEDFELMAAISPSEEPYLKTSAMTHARKRIVWLLVLMLSATITGAIITRYENMFALMPALVAFIPMLMDTGGNCGAQASTLVIRGMAVDEIKSRDFFRVLWKEMQVAIMAGAGLAVINTVRIMIMYKDFSLALTASISLYATVCIAKSLGCILPMAASKAKIDPALMASPLITTLVDAFAVFTYFNVARIIMKL